MKRQLKQQENTSASSAGGNGKLHSRKESLKSLEDRIVNQIHELSEHGRRFQEIAQFIDRADMFLVWPEIREMCAKSAAHCLTIRNLLIEKHDRKHG